MNVKKVFFFVAEDFGFLSHRLPMAEAFLQSGYQVTVISRANEDGRWVEKIRNLGFDFIPLKIKRGGINPFVELITVLNLFKIIKQHKPDILFNVAFKPIIYGSICARFCKIRYSINLIAGTGVLFLPSEKIIITIIALIIKVILKITLSLKKQVIIVQNSDDLKFFKSFCGKNIIKKIRGSGVDVEKFVFLPEPNDDAKITATFVGRMIKDKGVIEFIKAAEILKKNNIRMLMVGSPDKENPSSISEDVLNKAVQQNIIEWIPKTDDILSIWKQSHIAVLPSYSEGSPKCLIEAGACGRAIVTTDVNGCKELVRDEHSGLLVPIKDYTSLANAIVRLSKDKNLREEFGKNINNFVKKEYSNDTVRKEIFDLIKIMEINLSQ